MRLITQTSIALLVMCAAAVWPDPLRSAYAQGRHVRQVTDHVQIITDSAVGETQIVLHSERGLAVFNTFWSERPARLMKESIREALGRDDFRYTLNMFDRLDYFGGNAAYAETEIIGHDALVEKYQGKDDVVAAEIREMAEMWRWKENASRERLAQHEAGSEAALNEERWIVGCKERADDLEQGFSPVLPTRTYADRMTLDLGDVTLRLIWIGKAGLCNGTTVAVVPEDKLAIIPHNIMSPAHLAPHPHPEYKDLDVDRWISVLEELLEGEDAVETVICHTDNVWAVERARDHLEYIRRLWNATTEAAAAGKDLAEVQEQLSLERDFAFVKEMQTYKDHGDDWVRPQHMTHVRLFFLQHKHLASEIIWEKGLDSLQVSLAEIRTLLDNGDDLYFDEASINWLGYHLMGLERFADAIAVLRLNVEAYPNSANAYDSLGEAFMKSGDRQKAIENYRMSLQLNPENDNAQKMLETLRAE